MLDILFVDDDQNILRGLKRSFWVQRDVWSMRFASGAAAALAMIDDRAPDVVITDLRMPEVDGASLLHEIRTRAPGAIRIVLSGHAEDAAMIRAQGAAHRMAAKPCSNDALKAEVDQALALRRRLAQAGTVAGSLRDAGLMAPAAPFTDLSAVLQRKGFQPSDLGGLVDRYPELRAALEAATARVGERAPPERLAAEAGATIFFVLCAGVSVLDAAPQGLGATPETWAARRLARAAHRRAAAWARHVNAPAEMLEGAAAILLLTPIGSIARRIAGDGPIGLSGAVLVGNWGLPDLLVEGLLCCDAPSAEALRPDKRFALAHAAFTAERIAAEGAGAATLDIAYLERSGLDAGLDALLGQAGGE